MAIRCQALLETTLGMLFITGKLYASSVMHHFRVPAKSIFWRQFEQSLNSTEERYCKSAACRRQSSIILDSIDQSLDPCEDFYQFACGKWIAKASSTPGHDQNVFASVERGLYQDMKDVLENTPFKTEKPNGTDKVLIAYHSCVNDPTDGPTQIGILTDFLKQLGVDNWPETEQDSDENKPWEELWADLYYSLDSQMLLNMLVTIDFDNTSTLIYYLNFGKHTMESHFIDAEETNSGINETKEVCTTYLMRTMSLFRPSLTEDDLSRIATDVYALQTRFHEMTEGAKEATNSGGSMARTTLSNFSKGLAKVDWLKLLNTLFKKANVTLMGNESVMVTGVDYFEELQEVLENVPRSTMRNFLVWNALLNIASKASWGFGTVLCEAISTSDCSDLYGGIPTWKVCAKRLGAIASTGLSRLYAQHKFPPNHQKKVRWILRQVKEALREEISTSAWLDQETKLHFLNKLMKMDSRVAYTPLLFNDTIVDSTYASITGITPRTPFLEIFAAFQRLTNYVTLGLLRDDPDDEDTTLITQDPLVVNAHYIVPMNLMDLRMGFMRPPLFDAGRPEYINLATFGSFLGHELTHGFDVDGVEYDADGNRFEKLTNDTRQKFIEKGNCFMRQYKGNGNLSAAQEDFKPSQSLGEDMADNGAERLILRIYVTNKLRDPSWVGLPLPGLTNYTSDQIFFISQAVMWCEIPEPPKETDDPHSPHQMRVNVPLSNVPEFAAAFRCPPRSLMSPPEKCTFW